MIAAKFAAKFHEKTLADQEELLGFILKIVNDGESR